ncbi:MAG TPA: hypothetical protein VFQ53_00690 [Kofleriaceae bacterium]|nr:hypothetical protein [Kofleriaceae bacterium]
MSLFRKTATIPTPEPTQSETPPTTLAVAPPPPPSDSAALFDGPNVDVPGIYRSSKLSGDELDRVKRAEELLQHLPKKTAQTREVVETTFRVFGVDQAKILDAARKQLDALESFVRFSHDQTHRVLDANAKRIAQLEAEIERCRQASAQATREGEDRARTVNTELLKVQSVLEFFGEEGIGDALGGPTVVTRPGADDKNAAH